MINKTERYFVVSESELEAVCEANRKAGFTYQLDKRVQEAEAACRAREVRFIGAAEQGSSLMLWGEVKK